MIRPALIVGSILLFGCGTPFQLLVHNELSRDSEITVRWSQTYEGKKHTEEESAFIPKGRAEEMFVWYGPPDNAGVDFLWKDPAGEHHIHVPTQSIPSNAYHAYLDAQHVRFEKEDWMDGIHLNLTSYMAPVWWCCIFSTFLPLGLLARHSWRRRFGKDG